MAEQREAIEAVLRGSGLTDEPEKYDGSIHGWRCAYPSMYGQCDCFHTLVDDLMKVME